MKSNVLLLKKKQTVLSVSGTLAAEVPTKKTSFIWNPWILQNHVNVISGPQGSNKSSFVMFLAAKLSRGLEPTGNKIPFGAGRTLYYANEDDAEIIAKRYSHFGGENGRLRIVTHHEIDDEIVDVSFDKTYYIIENDISLFRPKLVVFDVFSKVFGEMNITEAKHVNRVFSMLRKWCETYQTTILLVHHSKQSPTNREDCLEGSIALRRAVRSAAYITRFGLEGDSCRIIAPYKMSWVKEPSPLHFEITSSGPNGSHMDLKMGSESEFGIDEIISLQAKYASSVAKARLKKLGLEEE